jgi:hypothetical protein
MLDEESVNAGANGSPIGWAWFLMVGVLAATAIACVVIAALE